MTKNNVPTYLLHENSSPISFYRELSAFTDKLLNNLDQKQKFIIKNYSEFIRQHSPENTRDKTDHMLEILIAGHSAVFFITHAIFFPRLTNTVFPSSSF